MEKVPTPGKTRCEDVAALLGIPLEKTVKAVAVVRESVPYGTQGWFALVLVRGDHDLNEIKTQKVLGPFRFASDGEIEEVLHCRAGYIGPVGAGATAAIYVDRTVAKMSDFVCGANEAGYHLAGVNWGRDLKEEPSHVDDLRNVKPGDPSPDGKGTLEIVRGIEVGHIFQLRTKYSEALGAVYLDEKGESRPMEMGCYGIGVTRVVAAAIEQNHDERGIAFPAPMAPFEACLVPIGYQKSPAVREAADRLYADCIAAGIDVLMDDRGERPGVMFADMDLIGIPHRLVLGERGLAAGMVEYKGRREAKPQDLPLATVVQALKEKLAAT
jgi:prolyl-tRNA synthetase